MNAIIIITVVAAVMVGAIPLVMRWDRQQREREQHKRD